MEIVEQQRQRLPGGEALEQMAHRPVGADALGGRTRLIASRIERHKGGKDCGELGPILRSQAAEAARVHRLEVGVESVYEQAKRKLALDLRGAPQKREGAPLLGLANEPGQQRRLADAGLAGNCGEAGRARASVVKQALERQQLPVASDQQVHRLRSVALDRTQDTPVEPAVRG